MTVIFYNWYFSNLSNKSFKIQFFKILEGKMLSKKFMNNINLRTQIQYFHLKNVKYAFKRLSW